MNSDDIEIKTREFIIETVQDHWERRGTACMLSALGAALKAEVPESRFILGDGLRSYLRQNLLVKLVQFPDIVEKTGAIPLAVAMPDDPRTLFNSSRTKSAVTKKPIYLQEFWNGFINPIDDGMARIVDCSKAGKLEISDINADDYVDKDRIYRVYPKDITPHMPSRSITDRAAETNRRIESWLTSHGLENSSEFLRPLKTHELPSSNKKLGHLISAFDDFSDDDLARISIPLDILSKLIKSK